MIMEDSDIRYVCSVRCEHGNRYLTVKCNSYTTFMSQYFSYYLYSAASYKTLGRAFKRVKLLLSVSDLPDGTKKYLSDTMIIRQVKYVPGTKKYSFTSTPETKYSTLLLSEKMKML